jgi:hypothetical protein
MQISHAPAPVVLCSCVHSNKTKLCLKEMTTQNQVSTLNLLLVPVIEVLDHMAAKSAQLQFCIDVVAFLLILLC